jgi:hypothetical protein
MEHDSQKYKTPFHLWYMDIFLFLKLKARQGQERKVEYRTWA